MICTGRSDFPNQVNNVLCFPFIFRGALDVRRHRDQRGDEAGRGRGDRAAGARSAVGCGGARLRQRRSPGLRAGLADPEPVRSAADPAHRAGGGEGGDGVGRRLAADRGFRRLQRAARALRVPLRPRHEADVRQGQDPAGARDLRRRRGRARAARDPGRAGGEAGAADPGRTSVGGRGADQAVRPVDQGRAGFRPRQSRGRSALPVLCADPISMSPAATA